MPRIAFVIGSTDDWGGVESVLYNLALAFRRRNYEVVIINLFGGSSKNKFSEIGCKICSVYQRKVNYFFTTGYVLRLRNLLNKEQPDFLFDMGSHFALFSGVALTGKKIKHISCEHVNLYASKKNFIVKSLFCRLADVVVTLTDDDAKNYQRIGINSCCIPNFSPFTSYDSSQEPREKIILAVGRLCYQKGFERLIDAWAKINNKKGYILNIWGDGPDKACLKKQIEDLNVAGTCFLKGFCWDIQSEYKKASLLAMSSRFEGFPMVLIEGLAFGLPLVSFDCKTGPSKIIRNNKNGLLVPEGDTQLLADALERVLADDELLQELSSGARESSLNYSEEKIMQMWEALLNRV